MGAGAEQPGPEEEKNMLIRISALTALALSATMAVSAQATGAHGRGPCPEGVSCIWGQ